MTGSGERRERKLIVCCLISAVLVSICALLAIAASWHWPLFGDEGIFHYIVFSMQHGAKPYTDIKDFNLPGTYLLDACAMLFFGGTPVGERIYDLCLCLLASVGFYLCLGRSMQAKIGAAMAAALLVLVHLQDGLAQEGQRDFAMAAFALLACGTYTKIKKNPLLALFLYQLIVGFIFTIKPTLAPLFLVPLIIKTDTVDESTHWQKFSTSIAGFGIAPLVTWGWLFKEHACRAFYSSLTTLGAVHSQLARKSFFYLASHCTSPVVVLLAIWLAMLLISRRTWTRDSQLLGIAAACGFISYWLQGKGLAYQRYPFLALFLALFFVDMKEQLPIDKRRKYIVVSAYALIALWFAPSMLHRVRSFRPVTPFESALEGSLNRNRLVSSRIQCIDTFSGCLTTLYNLRVTQSTGYLYDCYLFTEDSHNRAEYRGEFLEALENSPPAALIITDQNCFQQHAGFDRINSWGEFSAFLSKNYALQDSWESQEKYLLWSRPEVRPAFRVYILQSLRNKRL